LTDGERELMSGFRLVAVAACLIGGLVLIVTLSERPSGARMPSPPPIPSENASDAEYFHAVCAVCHGADGEGNVELRTPSIAGQPGWYLKAQMDKFRNGRRGTHLDDATGKQMRAIAVSMRPTRIAGIVEFVRSMPPWPTRRTVEGDVRNGELVYGEQCMECHRYNGQGERAFRSSPLTAFQDWYLASGLEKFRDGVRGYHPGDVEGRKMRAVVEYIDPVDLRDVIAYLSTLAADHPPGR
jgi:cytochrome c553